MCFHCSTGRFSRQYRIFFRIAGKAAHSRGPRQYACTVRSPQASLLREVAQRAGGSRPCSHTARRALRRSLAADCARRNRQSSCGLPRAAAVPPHDARECLTAHRSLRLRWVRSQAALLQKESPPAPSFLSAGGLKRAGAVYFVWREMSWVTASGGQRA